MSGSSAEASDILCGINLVNTFLIARGGRLARYGFILGLAVQVPWGLYGWWTGQPGFIVVAVVYGAIYAIGIRHSLPSRTR